jgi:hypothetical protein
MLDNAAYDEALRIFEEAVKEFSRGNVDGGDALLSSLDYAAIEKDRLMLTEIARTGQPSPKPPIAQRSSKRISASTKAAVRQRDRYHCRFTGRRLIDTRVFHEVARISRVFHFDEHHSVRETHRGPAGHPIVRTHAAAYEHVEPHSCGGTSDAENIVHTSVQLNESKGATILPQVSVPDDSWSGLTAHLNALKQQRTVTDKKRARASASADSRGPRPKVTSSWSPHRSPVNLVTQMREAALGLPVRVFSFGDEVDGEAAFRTLRATQPNWCFATPIPAGGSRGAWRIHRRLDCSSLDFNGDQKLTVKPKACAANSAQLRVWATQLGVSTVACTRCR